MVWICIIFIALVTFVETQDLYVWRPIRTEIIEPERYFELEKVDSSKIDSDDKEPFETSFGKVDRVGHFEECNNQRVEAGMANLDQLNYGEWMSMYPTLLINTGFEDAPSTRQVDYMEVDVMSRLFDACFRETLEAENQENAEKISECLGWDDFKCFGETDDDDDIPLFWRYSNPYALEKRFLVGKSLNYYLPYIVYGFFFLVFLITSLLYCCGGLIVIPWLGFEGCVGTVESGCFCFEYWSVGRRDSLRETKNCCLRCFGISNKALCATFCGVLLLSLVIYVIVIGLLVDLLGWAISVSATIIVLVGVSSENNDLPGTYFISFIFLPLVLTLFLRVVIRPVQALVFNSNDACDTFYHCRNIIHDFGVIMIPFLPVLAYEQPTAMVVTLLCLLVLRIDVLLYTYLYCFCSPLSPVLDCNVCYMKGMTNQGSKSCLEFMCLPLRRRSKGKRKGKRRSRDDVELEDQKDVETPSPSTVPVLGKDDDIDTPIAKGTTEVSQEDPIKKLRAQVIKIPEPQVAGVGYLGEEMKQLKTPTKKVEEEKPKKTVFFEKELEGVTLVDLFKAQKKKRESVKLTLASKKNTLEDFQTDFSEEEVRELENLFDFVFEEDGEEEQPQSDSVLTQEEEDSDGVSIEDLLEETESIIGVSDDQEEEKDQLDTDLEDILRTSSSSSSGNEGGGMVYSHDDGDDDDDASGDTEEEDDESSYVSDSDMSNVPQSMDSQPFTRKFTDNTLVPENHYDQDDDDDDVYDNKMGKGRLRKGILEKSVYCCCDCCENSIENCWSSILCCFFCECVLPVRCFCDWVMGILTFVLAMVFFNLTMAGSIQLAFTGDSDNEMPVMASETLNNVFMILGVVFSAWFASIFLNMWLFWCECGCGKFIGRVTYALWCVPLFFALLTLCAAVVVFHWYFLGRDCCVTTASKLSEYFGLTNTLESGLDSMKQTRMEAAKLEFFSGVTILYSVFFVFIVAPILYCCCLLGRAGKLVSHCISCCGCIRVPFFSKFCDACGKCAKPWCKNC